MGQVVHMELERNQSVFLPLTRFLGAAEVGSAGGGSASALAFAFAAAVEAVRAEPLVEAALG